jgi:hypothetical protein
MEEINIDIDGPDFAGTFDMTDDYGMNLLANTKHMKSADEVNMGAGQSFNIGGGAGGGGFGDIEIGKMDVNDAINIDFNGTPNTPNISIQKEASYYNGPQNSGFSTVQLNSGLTPDQERREKNHYITQLQRLEKKGYPITKQFTIDMPLQEMKEEYERLIDAKKLEGSIQWQRDAIVFAVNTLEMLNNNFPFLGLKLKGWKDSVQDKVESEQFDDIFEELYEKYKGKSYMPPEVRLLFGIASSGVLCHYSNKMLENIQTPSVESVLRSNPELARQVAAASMAQSMPGMANFVQANSGGGFGSANQASMRTGQASAQDNPIIGQGTGAFFGSGRTAEMPQDVAAQPAQQTARKEMRGPAGVDDILKTFQSVRMAEADNRPPTPPMSQQIPMSAAMAAAIDMQSVASEDFRSVMSDQTAGGTVRRKRRAPPVGNSISLAV